MRVLDLYRAVKVAEKRGEELRAAAGKASGWEQDNLYRQASDAFGEASDRHLDLAAWWRKVSLIALLVAVAEWLQSDATVERAALAMHADSLYAWSEVGEAYLRRTRVALAALSASLAPDKETL
jgi:hypothetical protein